MISTRRRNAEMARRLGTGFRLQLAPRILLAALVATALAIVSAATAPARRAVFLLAARDSGLLTLCPSAHEVRTGPRSYWESDEPVLVRTGPYGLQTLELPEVSAKLLLPIPPGPPTVGRSARTGDSLELDDGRIAPDPVLARWMAQEFARHREFTVVGSPFAADVVLVAEGAWRPLVVLSNGSNQRSMQMTGDWESNLLQAVMAFAVPASVYRQHLGDLNALLAARTWEGSVVYHGPQRANPEFTSASPTDLVRAFVRNASPPRNRPPVCAAANRLFSLEGVDFQGFAAQTVAAEPSADLPAGPVGPGTFRTSVTYVSVPLRVLDAENHPVTDVAASELSLEENGAKQKIDRLDTTSEPFDVVLLLDTSASMRQELASVQDAALRFLDSLRPIDRVMPVSFNDRVTAHAGFLADRKQLRLALFDIGKGEGTRLWDALDLILTDRLHRFAPGRRRAVVLFTDGVDTRSRLAVAAGTMKRFAAADMPVYAVQFDTRAQMGPLFSDQLLGGAWQVEASPRGALDTSAYAAGSRKLQELAEMTGGRVYSARTMAGATEVLGEIGRDLRTQYTIYYYPSNQEADGTLRSISVTVARPHLALRFRTSYRAPLRTTIGPPGS